MCIISAPYLFKFISHKIYQNYISNNFPKFRMVTSSRGMWVFPGIRTFYNVYENGMVEEIQEFSIPDNESYSLEIINIDKMGNVNINADSESEIPDDILEYMINIVRLAEEKDKRYLAIRLYVIDGRYLFKVLRQDNYKYTVHEYLPEKKQIREITGIDVKSLVNIDLYPIG